jgi:hypothetical protein
MVAHLWFLEEGPGLDSGIHRSSARSWPIREKERVHSYYLSAGTSREDVEIGQSKVKRYEALIMFSDNTTARSL